jgi:hypothetical protein
MIIGRRRELGAIDDVRDRADSGSVSGVINLDQPLQFEAFAAFVASIKDRLEGPKFDEVWQMFYDCFHAELLPADARDLVRSTCRPRQ